ncbi:hypothetical protein PF008_g4735 [Phytophthora fragariae]|uniref:Uncharacterized protein n=1 Tax=Phytophthora fragariae TaxID=53985 RepID=A0A6G0SAP3_9STRA|nr:hypothetical protein PF008_g4735 [Phytophthora fragariae]
MGSSDEDERKKRSINEMFGDEDSDDSGDEQIPRIAHDHHYGGRLGALRLGLGERRRAEAREARGVAAPKRVKKSRDDDAGRTKRRDDGEEYDSGEGAVATKEDDDFIDGDDDLDDVLGENDDDRQRRRAAARGRARADAATEGRPLRPDLKSFKTGRSRTKLSLLPQEMEQITQELLYRMDKAYADDLTSIAECRPALKTIKFVDSVLHVLRKLKFQPMLMDFDLLTIVKKWIQPLEDGSLLNVGLRTKMLEMVSKMPVFKEHLKRSGLGNFHSRHQHHEGGYRGMPRRTGSQRGRGGRPRRLLYDRVVASADQVGVHEVVHGVAIISRKTVDEQLEEVLEPLVELHSEFLIRGSFNVFEATFSIDKLTDDVASVSVGDNLSFELTTKKQYASINSLSSVEVSGVLCREEAGSKVEIGTVELKSNQVNESPGEAAFLRQLQPADANAGGMFANGGSHVPESRWRSMYRRTRWRTPWLRATPTRFTARSTPPSWATCRRASRSCTVCGPRRRSATWSSRASVCFDSNVVDYDLNFDGMVYPDEKLFMQARHIGLDDGKKILSVEVVTGSGKRVVSTCAVMKQAPMAFAFTGQGSAAVNMGMDRYQESSVACEIWNRGDVTQHVRFLHPRDGAQEPEVHHGALWR